MRRDDGSTAVLVSGVIGTIAALSIAVAGLGLAYSARAQAQTASDAAALAAAVATYPPALDGAPLDRARQVAEANGAALVSCTCPVDSTMSARVVTVVTAVAVEAPMFGHLEMEATSRAEFDPRLWLGR